MRRKQLLYLSIMTVLVGATYFIVRNRRSSTPSLEDAQRLTLPVTGTWQSINSPGHDRFAFDLAAVDPRSHRTLRVSRVQHTLGRARVSDSYSWSEPVLAPVAGTVVHASDGSPDREHLHLIKDVAGMFFARPEVSADDLSPFAGNYVILHADDFYVFLAHLQAGSVEVNEGDTVEVGQRIGRIGNSGFTLEPHLHFQLFDQIDDLLTATALPFVIDRFERWNGETWEVVDNAPLEKGDLVRTVQEDP